MSFWLADAQCLQIYFLQLSGYGQMLQPQHPALASLISQIKRVKPLGVIREKLGKMARKTLQDLVQMSQQQKLFLQIMRDSYLHIQQ